MKLVKLNKVSKLVMVCLVLSLFSLGVFAADCPNPKFECRNGDQYKSCDGGAYKLYNSCRRFGKICGENGECKDKPLEVKCVEGDRRCSDKKDDRMERTGWKWRIEECKNGKFIGTNNYCRTSCSNGECTDVTDDQQAPSEGASDSEQRAPSGGGRSELLSTVEPERLPRLSRPALQVGCTNNKNLDFDGDGGVGFDDFLDFAGRYYSVRGDGNYGEKYDLNSNGEVDFNDFIEFAGDYGKKICVSAKPVGDGKKTELKDCDEICDDEDGCKCPVDKCNLIETEKGKTCGGEKPAAVRVANTVVGVVQTILNIEPEPPKIEVKIKTKRKECKNMKKGDKCKIESEVEVLNAKAGDVVPLSVVFNWKDESFTKSSGLKIGSGSSSGSGSPLATRAVLDITGNVIGGNQNLVTQRGRFRCQIYPDKLDDAGELLCCPAGYETSERGDECVEKMLEISREDIIIRINKLFREYLEIEDKTSKRAKQVMDELFALDALLNPKV